MRYNQFGRAIVSLINFFEERKKLENAIKAISPNSIESVEFGAKFIDEYISLIEIALSDYESMISWFVFENDFGKNNLKIKINKRYYKISTVKDIYKAIEKYNQLNKKI